MALNAKATEIFYQSHELSLLATGTSCALPPSTPSLDSFDLIWSTSTRDSGHSIDSNSFHARFQSIELALSRLHAAILLAQEDERARVGQRLSSDAHSGIGGSLGGVGGTGDPTSPRLILSHTLMNASTIMLYSLIVPQSDAAYQRCIVAATASG